MIEQTVEYYLLDISLDDDSAVVEDMPDLEDPFDNAWIDGVIWDEDEAVPEPLVYRFEAGHLHPYYSEWLPLMNDKLLAALVR